jgi:predicted Zn-dependent protease
VEDASITSTLYAALCQSEKQRMIVSTARLLSDAVIETVLHHELGHMRGLDHCDGVGCIMESGQHALDIKVSSHWCNKCAESL